MMTIVPIKTALPVLTVEAAADPSALLAGGDRAGGDRAGGWRRSGWRPWLVAGGPGWRLVALAGGWPSWLAAGGWRLAAGGWRLALLAGAIDTTVRPPGFFLRFSALS
jgi:hypothetical protein